LHEKKSLDNRNFPIISKLGTITRHTAQADGMVQLVRRGQAGLGRASMAGTGPRAARPADRFRGVSPLRGPTYGSLIIRALLAPVLVNIFCDSLPLYRQAQIFALQCTTPGMV
jgi:hypothetical protein